MEKQSTLSAPLSANEKRDQRFKRWLNPEVAFSNPEAKHLYQARVSRIIDAIRMKEPDRVPVQIPAASYVPYHAGSDLKTFMNNYGVIRKAWMKFHSDFDIDASDPVGSGFPGKAYELMDYRLYKWPGHGLSDDTSMVQFYEQEYMKPEEYDDFIKDPLSFALKFFLPRSWGVMAPLASLPSFGTGMGIPVQLLSLVSRPDWRVLFERIRLAAEDFSKWIEVSTQCREDALMAGMPPWSGSMASAPFDHFADFLRGTAGIARDMFRIPDKLLEAMERITPLIIESAISMARHSISPLVIMPLHKGDDIFMSKAQFEKFYWPTFKKVMLGLIEEGLVPVPIADGKYNQRLEYLQELPKASTFWIFEQTDMKAAKNALAKTACIGGNVTASMLCIDDAAGVKEYCRKLIENCGKGGGYILTVGSSMDKCKTENLQAMVTAVKEYGVYRK